MNHLLRQNLVPLLLLITVSVFGQTGSETLGKARQLYQDESWDKAFSLVVEKIPENTTEGGLKSAAAELLTTLATAEFEAKNFKNAYDGVRKALKFEASNAKATQLFLKIRKLGDVTKLTNDAPPRAKAAPPVAQDAPVAAAPVAVTPASSIPAVAPVQDDSKLLELKAALEQSGERLKQLESNVASAGKENEALRAQAEKQSELVQTFLQTQANAKKTPETNSAQTARERELAAQTLALLAKISEREAKVAQTPAASTTDPAVLEALKKVGGLQAAPDYSGLLFVVLAVVGLLFFAILVAVVLLIVASRRRAIRRRQTAFDPTPNFVPSSGKALPSGRDGQDPYLLEFMGPKASTGSTEDFDIRRDLMKADRLKRMYEEVKQGTLSWSTVREYIGELELSLKTEILKVVETKLNEGELVSSEAIFPVVFPFLTDYDDFIRQKSESLVRKALTDAPAAEGSSTGNQKLIGQGDSDVLGVRMLMEIPQELTKVLKAHDQTLITAKVCRGIGNVLNLSADENNLLYRTALAHDCGYLMLDQDNLQRIIGKQEIREEDFEFIKSHTVKGPLYFGETELPLAFREGLLHHHERNDGSGYPDGLKKDDIHQFAKIIGVAETFAALITSRPYREKRDIQHALAIISDGARTKFDAEIVEALKKVAVTMGRP